MPGRRIPVKLDLEAAGYINEARRVEVSTKVMDASMSALDREVDKVDRSMAELAATTAAAKHEVDDLGDKARGSAADLSLLDARIKATKASVRELGLEFARTGDKAVGTNLGKERSLLGRLERLRKELGDLGNAQGTGVISAPDAPGAKPLIIGGLVAAVVAAAPTIGAILGGAIAGATGTAAMAAGIFAATRDPRVQVAAAGLGQTISTEIGRAGADFVNPVLRGLHTLDSAVLDMQLPEALSKVAPTVEVIAKGLAALGLNVMPGLNAALDRMGPFADAAALGFAQMGEALGQFFDDVTASKGTVEGLSTLFHVLDGTIRALGGTIHFLSDAYRQEIKVQRILLAEAEGLALATGHIDLAVRLHEVGVGIDNMVAGTHDASSAQSQFALTLQQSTAAAGELDHALSDATQGLLEFHNAQLDSAETAEKWEADLDNLADSVRDNGRSLDIHTEQGRANRGMLRGLAEDAMRTRDANIASGMSIAAANNKYQQQLQDLLKLATQLGLNTAAVWNLIGAYNSVPRTITTEFIQEFTSRGVPMGEHSGLRIGDTQGRASGGPVLPGQTYQVGESGPEWLTMGAQGGYVTPMAQPWSGAGAAALPPVNIAVQLVDSITGRVTRQQLITDALNRGQPGSVVAAAYP